jgi:two-component system NtrC family sensor kinase
VTSGSSAAAIAASTLRLARNELRHHARVVVALQPVPRVRASEARLGQVLLNLLVNAAQAIPQGESDKNQISVRTSVDGSRVRIDVEDSGVGMTEAVRARLFTPFFTTKPIGIGTGLGLSICQRVVSSLGGEILVETSPGVGSVFSVLLPAAAGEPEPSSAGAVPAIVRRRVLLIDDDEVVVRALVRALRPHHDVVGVTRAGAAIAEVERALPDVIICDVMMPDTTGAELIERMTERWPSVRDRVLFLTGGVFGEGARELEAHEHGRVLHKPIALADLLDAIERVGAR